MRQTVPSSLEWATSMLTGWIPGMSGSRRGHEDRAGSFVGVCGFLSRDILRVSGLRDLQHVSHRGGASAVSCRSCGRGRALMTMATSAAGDLGISQSSVRREPPPSATLALWIVVSLSNSEGAQCPPATLPNPAADGAEVPQRRRVLFPEVQAAVDLHHHSRDPSVLAEPAARHERA